MRADLVTLEAAIGHSFQNRDVFRRALTHSSSTAETSADLTHNEQLEFLGDSILGFLLSEALVQRFPDYREGALSKLKAHLASSVHLHQVARSLNLGAYLVLGKGEEHSGGRLKPTLLANATEALIAALYLDAGMEAARAFIERFVIGGVVVPPEHLDLKGELQELAQAHHLPAPRYSILESRGPEHAKLFTVEVRMGKDHAARAEGPSKKIASQRAAKLMLIQIRQNLSEAPGRHGSEQNVRS